MDRCGWCGVDPVYVDYHDTEWGVPEWDSRALWEKLILDGFQAGLSWITILKKRDNFRNAFAKFDPNEIATWGEKEVEILVQNAGIIRHRDKIEATIGNARAWQRSNNAKASTRSFGAIWRTNRYKILGRVWRMFQPIPRFRLRSARASRRPDFDSVAPRLFMRSCKQPAW